MTHTRSLIAALPITLTLLPALALTGCLRANDGFSDEDYDDVAAAVGSLVANESGGEIGSIEDSLAMTEGSSVAAAVEGLSGHIIIERSGLTYEYFADCRDAAGTVQTVCDAATDSAAIAVTWTGDLNLPRYQANIERAGEWTFTGLQGDVVELNGDGSFDIESHFQALYRPVTRDLVLTYEAEYDAVQYDRTQRRINSGAIRYHIEGIRSVTRPNSNREAEFIVDAEITFDAAGAILVLDGSRTYRVDLATGTVTGQ